MKFTLAIFALLSASVSSMRLSTEIQSFADIDANMLIQLESDSMEGLEMTPAQQK